MISGQGTLECFWDYDTTAPCDDLSNTSVEYSHYLIELAQRITYGADFLGIFYLHKNADRSVYQEAECIVTGASFQVSSGTPIRSRITFLTTGPFKLSIGRPAFEILREEGTLLLQEDDTEIFQENSLD